MLGRWLYPPRPAPPPLSAAPQASEAHSWSGQQLHGAKHREHPRRMELRCQKHSDDQRKVRAHVGERAGEFVAVNRTCGQSCGCRASIVLVCAMCQRRLKARLDQLHETRTARYMRLYTFCLWLDVQLSRLYLVKSVV